MGGTARRGGSRAGYECTGPPRITGTVHMRSEPHLPTFQRIRARGSSPSPCRVQIQAKMALDLVFWGLPQPLTQGLQPIRQSGSVIPGSTEPHKRIRVAQTTRQGPDVPQPVKPVGRHWSPVTGAHSTRHLVATERGISLPPSTWEQPPQCPRDRVDQAVSAGHGSLERSSLKETQP